MLLLKYLFVILHIITAAAWFGIGLRLSAQARAAAGAAGVAGEALTADGQRSVRLMNIFILLTLVFALGAFFTGGGFGGYGPVYHTSLLLIVVLAGLQFFVIRMGWRSLREALTDGRSTEVERARKRVAVGTGIGHLLWLVLLVLMFWNELSVAL